MKTDINEDDKKIEDHFNDVSRIPLNNDNDGIKSFMMDFGNNSNAGGYKMSLEEVEMNYKSPVG